VTRLSDRLVVQRVDDLLVVMDEQAGAEIVFDPQMRERLVETIDLLFPAEAILRLAEPDPPTTGYVSAPYWFIVCQEPGCGVKSTEDSEYSAWADTGGARDEALDSDWAETTDGLFFCSEHRNRACSECSKHVPGGTDVEHDSMCDECWTEDAKDNHGHTPTPSTTEGTHR